MRALDRFHGLVIRVLGCRSRGPGFDSRRCQIFWEIVSLERRPLCLVSTIEELLARKTSSSSLEGREYGRRDPLRWQRVTLYPQKLELSSPTSGGRYAGIGRSRTQSKNFFISIGLSVKLTSHFQLVSWSKIIQLYLQRRHGVVHN
jgi:hypothetical protein